MRHLDLLRRFPLKTLGCRNSTQKLLDMVKTPNKPKPNQRPKIQLLEQLRKSTNVSYLAALVKVRSDLFVLPEANHQITLDMLPDLARAISAYS